MVAAELKREDPAAGHYGFMEYSFVQLIFLLRLVSGKQLICPPYLGSKWGPVSPDEQHRYCRAYEWRTVHCQVPGCNGK